MSFVTVKLKANLGNQMFQIATTIAHALRHGVEYKIPHQSTSSVLPDMPFKHLANWTPGDGLGLNFVQEHFGYQELPYWPKMRLEGYFQSEKYFKDYRKEVLAAFKFPSGTARDVVGIHVRRGDYLSLPHKHPVVTSDYLNKAIEYFTTKGYLQFRFFSDDIAWCHEFAEKYSNTDVLFSFSVGQSPMADLYDLSQAEHQIISNSTFSWWSAWANENPNKIVVTPHEDNWFGPFYKHLNTSDLIPEKWVRIKFQNH